MPIASAIADLVRRIDAELAWSRAQRGDYAGCYGEFRRLQSGGAAEDALQHVKELTGLAYCENGLGRHAQAAEHARLGWEFGRRRLGERHPQTLDMPWVLSSAETALGHFDAAVAAGEQAYEGTKQIKGERHSGVATIAQQIGYAHLCAGRPEIALDWLERSVAIRRAVLAAEDPRIASARSLRALALLHNGRIAAAQADMAVNRAGVDSVVGAAGMMVSSTVLKSSSSAPPLACRSSCM